MKKEICFVDLEKGLEMLWQTEQGNMLLRSPDNHVFIIHQQVETGMFYHELGAVNYASDALSDHFANMPPEITEAWVQTLNTLIDSENERKTERNFKLITKKK